MLLHYDDVDARAREQECEHHPGRPAAHNAAGGIQAFTHLRTSCQGTSHSDQPQFGMTRNRCTR
jgi:hypothetical protein